MATIAPELTALAVHLRCSIKDVCVRWQKYVKANNIDISVDKNPPEALQNFVANEKAVGARLASAKFDVNEETKRRRGEEEQRDKEKENIDNSQHSTHDETNEENGSQKSENGAREDFTMKTIVEPQPEKEEEEEESKKRKLEAESKLEIIEQQIVEESVPDTSFERNKIACVWDPDEILACKACEEVCSGLKVDLVGLEDIDGNRTNWLSASYNASSDTAARYMFESPADRSAAIDSRRDMLLDIAVEELNAIGTNAAAFLEEGQENNVVDLSLHPVSVPASGIVWIGGRLGEARRHEGGSERTWVLEGVHAGENERITLDLESARSPLSLFPGMVGLLRGTTSDGKVFRVHSFFGPPPLPIPSSPLLKIPLKVMFAGGPFSPHENLHYKPLTAVIEEAQKQKVSCLVLTGPFVDESHPSVKHGHINLSFENLFYTKLAAVLKSSIPQVILVPSPHDAHHRSRALPQDPFDSTPDIEELGFITLAPNPCHLKIRNKDSDTNEDGSLCISIVAGDVIANFSSAEQSHGATAGNRFGKFCKHMLEQRSVFPIYPANVPIDATRLESLSFPSASPHVLVTPSKLNPFARKELGVVCINPGQCGRYGTNGNYAILHAVDGKMAVEVKRLLIPS